MSFLRLLVLLAVVAVVVGCGPSAESVTPPPERSPAETVKAVLEQAAETGQGGSALGEMMDALEKMKATDAEKAGALEEDANALMSMSDPAEIKAKAKEMLGKLEAPQQE